MSNNTGDRITYRGIEVVFVKIKDADHSRPIGCYDCPFTSNEDKACEKAPCDRGYLLTVPDYVKWKLTK